MTESFVLLSALGGEGIEDMERLRADEGLETMLGYSLPACETARQWLDKFHDESLMIGRPLRGMELHREGETGMGCYAGCRCAIGGDS